MKPKKIIVSFIAIAMSISAFPVINASAYESQTWYARDVNVPGTTTYGDYVDTLYLTASAYTYTGTCTDMTNLSNRATTIWSSTHQMRNSSNTYNISSIVINTPWTSQDWCIVNWGSQVTYKVSCSTTQSGTLESQGEVRVNS